MNLLEQLNARIDDALEWAGIGRLDEHHHISQGHDPDDYLIRQELKHWVGHQTVPGQAKLRLLQAAALQKDAPVSRMEKTGRKKPKHYPPEPWGQEFLPGYLVLAFTYTHVRNIA